MKHTNNKKHGWNAADYEQHSSSQQRWAQEVIAQLTLNGDERILDIGCGDGKVTARLAACVPRGCVLGIDSSEEMIAFAQAKFPPTRIPNLSFTLGDAAALDFDHDFDLVVSFSCLHWVHDQAAVLTGIRKSLMRSGRVVLQFGGKGNAASVRDATADVVACPRWRPYFENFHYAWTFCDPQEYRALLHNARFTPQRVELVPKDMVQKGVEELKGWFRTTWLPYVERVPEALRDEFVADIVQRYVEQNPLDAEGRAHVRMIRLEIEATTYDHRA
ncbi:MAG: class I SAM-dependent methyltransferase [Halobacteriota archaeon]